MIRKKLTVDHLPFGAIIHKDGLIMKNVQKLIGQSLSLTLALALCANITVAQATATLRGQVTDEFGGAIVGATVTLIDAKN
ncbi:MAG TPA: hypothetical protein VGV87_06140, partial [Blastocatellia bacterium]|nr:hypothetical protein [Blastocatellia bacterium]